MAAATKTEETVRKVLDVTYGRFGFQRETSLIAHIVGVLEDDSKRTGEGSTSKAAHEIRMLLWENYGGTKHATCDLFWALSRQEELGWVKEEVGTKAYNDEDYRLFLARLSNVAA